MGKGVSDRKQREGKMQIRCKCGLETFNSAMNREVEI
jgi:hypothetical protein